VLRLLRPPHGILSTMILDHVQNAALYRGLGGRLARGLELMGDQELLARPPGRYELEGSSLFVIIQEYAGRPLEQGIWESHRKYIDIQCVLAGAEMMGHGWRPAMKATGPYNVEKDIIFYEAGDMLLRVEAGMFAVFFPDDVHCPGLEAGGGLKVRKAVFKVEVDKA
jgi:biofilm protein TabA